MTGFLFEGHQPKSTVCDCYLIAAMFNMDLHFSFTLSFVSLSSSFILFNRPASKAAAMESRDGDFDDLVISRYDLTIDLIFLRILYCSSMSFYMQGAQVRSVFFGASCFKVRFIL